MYGNIGVISRERESDGGEAAAMDVEEARNDDDDDEAMERFRVELENNEDSTLPAAEYARCVCRHVLDGAAFDGFDGWRSPLWTLLRILRAHPDLIGATAEAALAVFEAAMDAEGVGFTDFTDKFGYPDATEFLVTWDKIKTPFGFDFFTGALAEADARPAPKIDGPADFVRFVVFAAHLQEAAGEKPIILPLAALGPLLFPDRAPEAQRMGVSRLRQLAVTRGFLKVTREHQYSGRRLATEFRFTMPESPRAAEKATKPRTRPGPPGSLGAGPPHGGEARGGPPGPPAAGGPGMIGGERR